VPLSAGFYSKATAGREFFVPINFRTGKRRIRFSYKLRKSKYDSFPVRYYGVRKLPHTEYDSTVTVDGEFRDRNVLSPGRVVRPPTYYDVLTNEVA